MIVIDDNTICANEEAVGTIGVMTILIVVLVLIVAAMAVKLGQETRDYDDRDRRGWWPGQPR
jgi:hypothetical protein